MLLSFPNIPHMIMISIYVIHVGVPFYRTIAFTSVYNSDAVNHASQI